MYSSHEPLYKVIAREAYSQKKCFMCYSDLKGHKRCSICGLFLLCGKENICTDCKSEGVFFGIWKRKTNKTGGSRKKGYRKYKDKVDKKEGCVST